MPVYFPGTGHGLFEVRLAFDQEQGVSFQGMNLDEPARQAAEEARDKASLLNETGLDARLSRQFRTLLLSALDRSRSRPLKLAVVVASGRADSVHGRSLGGAVFLSYVFYAIREHLRDSGERSYESWDPHFVVSAELISGCGDLAGVGDLDHKIVPAIRLGAKLKQPVAFLYAAVDRAWTPRATTELVQPASVGTLIELLIPLATDFASFTKRLETTPAVASPAEAARSSDAPVARSGRFEAAPKTPWHGKRTNIAALAAIFALILLFAVFLRRPAADSNPVRASAPRPAASPHLGSSARPPDGPGPAAIVPRAATATPPSAEPKPPHPGARDRKAKVPQRRNRASSGNERRQPKPEADSKNPGAQSLDEADDEITPYF